MSRPPNSKVGYKKPPLHSRFKPGQSGNSKGRPKGRKSTATLLRGILDQKISVTENGKAVKYTVLEIALKRMAHNAMKGDLNSIKFMIILKERYGDSGETHLTPEELKAEDFDILAEYLPKVVKQTKRRRKP